MRLYQMDAKALALKLNSDYRIGRSDEKINKKNESMKFSLGLLNSVLTYCRTKRYFTDVFAFVFYLLTFIFSFLNKNYSLLLFSVFTLMFFILLNLLELIAIAWQRERHKLNCMASCQRVSVIRADKVKSIMPNELMVGDLMNLVAGDILHADARIFSCEHLFADEKFVFNTDIPSAKTAEPIMADNLAAEQQLNMLWKGSVIHSGYCRCMITALNEDCYIEKTGGRKERRQHSYYLNRQKNIGNIVTLIFLLIFAVLSLIAAFTTKRYLETIFLMAVLSSLLTSNFAYLMPEFIFYKTANQLYKSGTLVRNIEAFDGINREKEIYFDCEKLITANLSYSHLIPITGTEKISSSYFKLCVSDGLIGNALKLPEIQVDDTIQHLPGSAIERDSHGNYCGAFICNGLKTVVATGYWKNMMDVVKTTDESLIRHIEELEHQGKMVWLLAGKDVSSIFDPRSITSLTDHLNLFSMIVFEIRVDPSVKKQIEYLQQMSIQSVLLSRYSNYLTDSVARSYGLQKISYELPSKPSYSVIGTSKKTLVADIESTSFVQEQANLVLKGDSKIENVYKKVKQMFCGLAYTFNFILSFSIMTIISVFAMFLTDNPIAVIVLPLIWAKPLYYLCSHFFVSFTDNFSKDFKYVVFGVFCGLVGIFAVALNVEMAIVAAEFSMILLLLYFRIRAWNNQKGLKLDLLLLVACSAFFLLQFLFFSDSILTVFVAASFPPLAALVLDLFY